MAKPPVFPGAQRRADTKGSEQSGGNLSSDAQSLRNAIQRFVDAHGDDRRVGGVIRNLQSAQAELKRVGGDGRDAGPPSPGRKAALEAMNAKGTPSR